MAMKKSLAFLLLILVLNSCKTNPTSEITPAKETANKTDFTIAFGSCNNQVLENHLWDDIENQNPTVWIWGGDVIYSDTEDMKFLEKNFNKQKNDSVYNSFSNKIEILGTWDDHDYGINDGGVEYSKKDSAQQLFLNFLDVPLNDARRKQKGLYYSKNYNLDEGSVKIIVLDTRYFRSALTRDTETKKRYKPNNNNEGTMLGEEQWQWLKNELVNSKATFNIIVSSIQFLASEHGFETWGNMPHEVEKLENILKLNKESKTIILSGDRHISEFSSKNVEGLSYPLIDFTSSGLTHSYTNFKSEPNKFRVGNVVSDKSFGLLKFNFSKKEVQLEMRGDNYTLFESYTQIYN